VRYVLLCCRPEVGQCNTGHQWDSQGICPLAQGWLSGLVTQADPVGPALGSRLCPVIAMLFMTWNRAFNSALGPTKYVAGPTFTWMLLLLFFLLASSEIFPRGPEFFNNGHQSRWLCTVGKGSRKLSLCLFIG